MAKAYAEGFAKEYREIAYDAFLCGYSAKCSTETPKDLEEAAEKYAKGEGLDNALGGWEDMHDAFLAGAKWDRGQMMKCGIEKTIGQVEHTLAGNLCFFHGFEVTELDFPFLNSKDCGYGDKVRIIIVKEEGK